MESMYTFFKTWQQQVALSILATAFPLSIFATSIGGTIVTDGFVSKYVPNSPGKDQRVFNVYLPPTFFSDPTATFPTVYHLTGFGGDNTTYSQSDKATMDMMLSQGQIEPIIIVAPDPSVLLYEDNFYVNSQYQGVSVTGLFEDYIVRELIPYVDAKYRQKKDASGNAQPYRGIMGQSMGGYGSLYYGIKHPELFIAYCGDSSTSFWCINTTLANPPAYTNNPMYTFNKLLIPELPPTHQFTPDNGDNSFAFFAWAASFSPNPSRPFMVNYPFIVDDTTLKPELVTEPDGSLSFVPDPAILARWQTFDPYVLLDTIDPSTLQRQAQYLDAGNNVITETIDNVGANKFQNKLISLNANVQYLLFQGGHTDCTTIDELSCYRFTTNLKLCSGKFSEAGIYTPDVIMALTGTETIELTGNSVMSINNKAIVGIETAPTMGITATNITLSLLDSARVEIGNQTTIGGGFQIGNTFSKANLINDPSLRTNTVSFTLNINGPGATFQIGRQGFFGIGVGLAGNRTPLPNFWGVNSLANVSTVTFNLQQGNLLHNQIASSLDPKSALIVLGNPIDSVTEFTFTANPAFVISGGANLALISLANLLHPTVHTTAGNIPPGGIYSKQVFTQGLFDAFYGPPKGHISSQTIYTNTLHVNIFASSQMLADTRKIPPPAPATAEQLFAYLSVVDYLDQGTKRANVNLLNGHLTVAYETANVTGAEKIYREVIPLNEECSPLSANFNIPRIVAEGAVGIKLVKINGVETILRLYDLNPP